MKQTSLKCLLWTMVLVTALAGASAGFATTPTPVITSGNGFAEKVFTYPLIPVDSVPTHLLLETDHQFLAQHPRPFVAREGNTLRVYAQPGLGCCQRPTEYQSIELGLLEAGIYDIELYSGQLFYVPILEDTYQMKVVAGPRLTITPENPLAGDNIVARGEFGPDACPRAGQPLVFGQRITLPFELGGDCGSTSPDVALPGLASGTYEVEMVIDGQVFARREFTVTPGQALLRGGRFRIETRWKNAAGLEGEGRLVQEPSEDSALFYFFSHDNWELMVKVLDGCAINGFYWVFAAASTDVELSVTVHDLTTNRTFSFGNRLGQAAAATTAIEAFSCP